MLGSSYFSSSKNSESGFNKIRECPFDQGGYFIINGSEKVLIAQDRRGRALIMSMCSRRTNLASKPRWLKFVRMLSRTSSRGVMLILQCGISGQVVFRCYLFYAVSDFFMGFHSFRVHRGNIYAPLFLTFELKFPSLLYFERWGLFLTNTYLNI